MPTDVGLHFKLFLFYNDQVAKVDVEATDVVIEILHILFPGEYELQNHIAKVELPIYKNKLEIFDRPMAIKGCEVNNENFDLGNANFNNMFVTKVDILIK